MSYLAALESEMLKGLFQLLDFANGDFVPNFFPFIIEESNLDPPDNFAEDGLSTNFC